MNVEIELRHLRYFVAVAEELHFGRAAARLHVAQPPLSQQIRKLEESLGCALFTRTSRSVALTSAGEALLERARRTLRNMERDIEETRSVGHGDVGSLHVGFVGSSVMASLPAIFRAYRERHPRIQLHLHESFTSQVIEGMENGTLDAGILRDSDPMPGLTVATIYSEPFVAVLPAGHRHAHGPSVSLAVLREEPFVYYPRMAGARAYEKPLLMCEAHGFRPRIVQEASHWLTIMSLVGAGLGVSLAPACVRRIAVPEVACRPLYGETSLSHVELGLRVRDERAIVRRFARVVKELSRAVGSVADQGTGGSGNAGSLNR